MTSAVHSALPKTERHAPSSAHGGKSTKTGTDFQRLLHGSAEHRRAEVKSDDTATRSDNAVASGEHYPVRAKLNEKAATNDSPADFKLADDEPDQHREQTAAGPDGRSALDVLSNLISQNAADQAATAKQEPGVAPERGEPAAENSESAVSVSADSKPVATNGPANDNPKAGSPAEHHAADPAPRVPDHRTDPAVGEAHASVKPEASADALTSASKARSLPREIAPVTRPAPRAEPAETVDARITVTESRQYPAPASAATAVVEPGTQKPTQPEKTAAPATVVAAASVTTATVTTATSKPTVRSETRTQPVSTQRTGHAGGSAKMEMAVAPDHGPAKPTTADTMRATTAEPTAAQPEPTKPAGNSVSTLALNSTTDISGQPSDSQTRVREQPKIETLPARTEAVSGINATPVPPQATVTTGEALATSIADGLGEKKPLAAAANMPVSTVPQHQSAHVLKIELHPAELGAVTANLKVTGEQLSIEIKVENHEAYRRLSSDSDDLTNTLRKLGYDVDRITILQPQTAATPASRTDAQTSSPNTSSRDQSAAFSSSGQGGNSSNGDGQRSGRNPSHDAYASRDAAPARRDGGRNGIVI